MTVLSAPIFPLDVRGFSGGYTRDEAIVRDTTFTLAPSSMTALIGPNGAGKTTLLKGLLGLLPVVHAESVSFFGGTLDDARSRVAYIPQRSEIDWNFPASALDVVGMGLYRRLGLFRRVNRSAKEASREALRAVGLADEAQTQVGELSGGQQQRVLIARALVQDADMLFLDEPFVNVDAFTEERIAELLRGLRDKGRTILAVHHDLRSVRTHFDDAMLLNGRLLAKGAATEVMTDALLAEAYGFLPRENATPFRAGQDE
jgi:manganese/zinc/iron transport system ATP- binding protein